MRILLDVSNLGLSYGSVETRTGIFRATEFLIAELLRMDGLQLGFSALDSWVAEIQLMRYDHAHDGRLGGRLIRAWDAPGVEPESARGMVDALDVVGQESQAGKRLVAELALLNRIARPRPMKGSFELVHSLRHPLQPRDRVPGARRVVTIHDMVPVLFPSFCEDRFITMHRAVMQSVEPARDWILCNSACTRDDVCRLLAVPRERTFVTPFAADPAVFHPVPDGPDRTRTLERYGLEGRRYFLSLCTLEPRKNLETLLHVFFDLSDESEAADVALVLVGATGWKTEPLFELIESRPDLRDRIVLTGFVPDDDLAALYSAARAFVLPSLYEGFGLPPLEAMMCGTPVVTSTAGSLPEVVGSAAILVDPRDRDGLRRALSRLLIDDALAEALSREGLERAAQFSWSETAQKTVSAYRDILSAP